YTLQFNNVVTTRPFDFSQIVLGVPIQFPDGTSAIGLDEAHLDETLGVGFQTLAGLPGFPAKIAFGPVPTLAKPTVVNAGAAINWNTLGTGKASDSNDTNLVADINQTTQGATTGCPASPNEILLGFNDWANIQLNFRASVDVAEGAHSTVEEAKEITLFEALAL